VKLAVLACALVAATPVSGGAGFLQTRQLSDGSFAERGQPGYPQLTAWATLGLTAARTAPRARGLTIKYLSAQEAGLTSPTEIALVALAEEALGQNADRLLARLRALQRADGSVGLYSTRGALLRTVAPSSAVEVALRRDYLAVLTSTRTLEVFNSHSGRRLRSWHVAAGATHLDLAAGLAAYATGRRVHVVRLSTGKSVFGARANATVSAVQLEPAGLAYALQRGDRPGTIVFMPMARVLPRPPRR